MKNNLTLCITSLIFVFSLKSEAQTREDTLIALSIRKAIHYSPNVLYTFNRKIYDLNQDSLSLYEMSQKNPLPMDLQPCFESSDYSLTYSDNHGWHKGSLVKMSSDEDEYYYPHEYIYGVGTNKEAREFDPSLIKQHIVGKIRVVDQLCCMKTYLLFHPTIKPSEVYLGKVKDGGWEAVPLLTRYKKPVLHIEALSDSLFARYAYEADLDAIEALVNDKNLTDSVLVAEKIELTAAEIPAYDPSPDSLYDIVVSMQDTLIFKDFIDEDGDTISVYFDDNIVQEKIAIEHKPFAVQIKSKTKRIEIIAESVGTK